MENIEASLICSELLQWFDKNGRVFFWREHNDPYTVLLSEILLKKTSAESVDRFLPGFLERYGTIKKLYRTSESELVSILAPLGLSSQKAKQLMELAVSLLKSHGSKVPNDKDELLKLPGVGEYTAGALLSFSFDIPEAIVDTNIARVIARVWGITPSRCEARRSPEVWDKARQLINKQPSQAARINWAILDLGALICKSRQPKCKECPLNAICTFANQELHI
ncbi:hypothetical protein ACFLXA_04645 [Chloroflexota bacterium]